MTATRYATPEGFKQALETRLRNEARGIGVGMGRLRQVLIFERFLARVFSILGERVVAKGGVVLELRLARARTTRDLDLGFSGDLDRVLEALIRAGELDLGDRLSFRIEPDREHPTIDVEGMIYGGRRYRAEARLAGRLYGLPFGVDVAAGDATTVAPDIVQGSGLLAFVGLEPVRLRVYALTHVAEKLHAFTLPRSRPNSRVKDLPDLALLGQTGPFDASTLRARSNVPSPFARRTPHPRAFQIHPPNGRDPTPEWLRPTICRGPRSPTSSPRYEPSSTRSWSARQQQDGSPQIGVGRNPSRPGAATPGPTARPPARPSRASPAAARWPVGAPPGPGATATRPSPAAAPARSGRARPRARSFRAPCPEWVAPGRPLAHEASQRPLPCALGPR
jgi:hypothetical protein